MSKPTLPLNLIVAATPSLGIGANGTLPWRIKSEIQYFARVTSRIPAAITSQYPSLDIQNAVIMGRKTWESIPSKFRPLKGRVNVVLSSQSGNDEGAIWVRSMREAVQTLEDMRVDNQAPHETSGVTPKVARVFIIGGSTVYKAALEMPETKRVLLTKIQGDSWGCDTFFPVQLGGQEGEKLGWKSKTAQELRGWVEEEVAEGIIKEGDIEFEYCLFEKES
jgi:dihydrofolate reductase